jgi:Holliday junction DNA helicase RuvA
MISYLKGIVVHIDEREVILENSGIGYRIFVSEATAAALLPKGEQRQLFTYMNVKEDDISLYGFCTHSELQLFHKLITVSGVGPKGGLNLLSYLSPNELITAILTEDVKSLCKVPGVGKKMAQRLILELKDKLSLEDTDVAAFIDTPLSEDTSSVSPKFEALEALIALGYSRSEAIKALEKIYIDTMSTQQLLKAALKQLAF